MPSKLGVLPSLSLGQPAIETAPVISFDGVANAFAKLADSAGDIANHYFGKQAATEGEAAGDPQAVTMDASGKPQMPSPSWETVLSGQTAAFDHAAKFRFLADQAVATKPQVEDLKGQYPQDPIGLKTALDQFAGQKLSQTPEEFQPAIRSMLDEYSASALSDATKAKWEGDQKRTQGSADAILSDTRSQLQPFTANNDLQNQQAVALINQYHAVLANKVRNPIFNYSQEQADKDWNEFANNLNAQAAVGQAPQIYHESGGDTAQAEQRFTKLIDGLPLPFKTAEAYKAEGLASIRNQDTLARQGNLVAQQQATGKMDDAKAYALSGGQGGWRAKLPEDQIRSAWPKPLADQKIENLDEAETQGTMLKETALSSPSEIEALKPRYAAPGGQPQPPGGFDKAWQFTLQHEGGFAPHDANGAPVNYGINQAAHPGVDVKNLTPQQAKQIGKTGYWDQIGGDTLPPDMQAAAFDTAYIFGPKAAQLMVDQADGDPQKLIDIRQQRMQGLIAEDPAKFGKFANAWQQRNDDLRNFVSGSGNEAAQLKLHNAFDTAVRKRESDIAADPMQYVVDHAPGVSDQINSNDPGTRAAGVRTLLSLEAHVGVPANKMTVFTKEQVNDLTGQLMQADPGQAVAALQSATAGMTGPQLQIAARQLAPKNQSFAAAVSLASSSPMMSKNILIGERYVLQNPDAKPDSKNAERAFDGATGGNDGGFFQSATGGLFQFAPDARERTRAVSNALYARSMIGQPGKFDQNRYKGALHDALGDDPINVRGQYILPPRSGMSASDVENMLGKLDTGTLKQYGNGTPVLANGNRVNASDIAQHGILTYTGTPGIYRVRFPGQGHIGKAGGGSFMLNLGAFATGAPKPIPGTPAPQALLSTSGQWTGGQ